MEDIMKYSSSIHGDHECRRYASMAYVINSATEECVLRCTGKKWKYIKMSQVLAGELITLHTNYEGLIMPLDNFKYTVNTVKADFIRLTFINNLNTPKLSNLFLDRDSSLLAIVLPNK